MTDSSGPAGGRERRANHVLRALIDEMLELVRNISRMRDSWSADELASAEAELQVLMARVRKAAVRSDD